MLAYILMTIVIIVVIVSITVYIFNKFQTLIIKINEAEININSILSKKFDLLNRAIKIIKGNVKIERDILENIVKLRSRKLSDFELDKELALSSSQFYTIKDEFKELGKSDNFKKIAISLNDADEQLIATKKYYNDIAIKYNELARCFPSNIIAIVFKYKEKPFHIDNLEEISSIDEMDKEF